MRTSTARAAIAMAIVCLAATGRAIAPEVHGTARVAGHGQADVVVWIDAPGLPKEIGVTPVLDQRSLNFYPRVLAVRVGTVVEFPNHDRVFHNVFSFHDGKKFDLGMYPTGSMKRVSFDKPGLSRLLCSIHPHMAAYIMAVESSYFAVSGEGGAFTIRGLVPGTYTYHAWRAGAPELAGSAKIDPSTPMEIAWP